MVTTSPSVEHSAGPYVGALVFSEQLTYFPATDARLADQWLRESTCRPQDKPR